MRFEEAAAVGNLLSFSITAFDRGERFIFPGTGFRVGPKLALTAKHVVEEILRKLGLPEGARLREDQREYPVEVRAGEHRIGDLGLDEPPWWRVTAAFNSRVTDISVMVLEPGNPAASAADQSTQFLKWSLSPPSVGQVLWAFGLVVEKFEKLPIEESMLLKGTADARLQPLKVTAVYPEGRRSEPLEIPSILSTDRAISMMDFACFEMTGELVESMSGGPVFNGGVLYGVASTGWQLSDELRDHQPSCTAALLTPLRSMSPIRLPPDDNAIILNDLLTSGRIPSI
jgi:hypothetical protein